ncbi:MAG: hypothetical protein GTO41_26490 [Burkholderiales bacterium]|nr:hypothetical protein [Burkholderiales bacterium]
MKDKTLVLIALAVSTAVVVLCTASRLTDAVAAGKATAATASATRDLAVQKNSEGGVTVSVKPKTISAGAGSWDFEITLSTHTVELNQDLQSVSVLIDSKGKPHSPLSWEGDPPGGHHRKGVLRFKPLADAPTFLALHIHDVGGVDKRIFRWSLE